MTPCDYHFLVLQRDRAERDRCRFTAFMAVELRARMAESRLRRALANVLRVVPQAAGAVRYSMLSGRPCWRVPREPGTLAGPAFGVHDLRASNDWPRDRLARVQSGLNRPWRLSDGPLVGLDQVLGPDDRTLVCLRWPHALMDAEGGERFLRAVLDAYDSNRAAEDPRPARYPAKVERPIAVQLTDALRGWRENRRPSPVRPARLPVGRPDEPEPVRVTLRSWSGDRAQAVDSAIDRTPVGPRRHARHLAASVVRALHRLFASRGSDSPGYVIPFPTRVRGLDARPMTGNYLVAPNLVISAEAARDRRRLDGEIQAQLDAFFRAAGDVRQWALLWASGWMRSWQYEWVMRRRLRRCPLSCGFSYYSTAESWRDAPQATGPIEDFFCGGAVSLPPGLNPVFCRNGDSLTLTLAWVNGYHTAELAEQFANLIDEEVMSA